MEPRIAGSVSRAADAEDTPRGLFVNAEIAPQLFPDLFTGRRTTPLGNVLQKKKTKRKKEKLYHIVDVFDDIYVSRRCAR